MQAGGVSINLPKATARAMISTPHFSQGHPSRHRDCQRSVVTELNDLVDRAATAGWSRREVIVALADLLDAETDDASGLLQMMAANHRQADAKRAMMAIGRDGLKSGAGKSCG
ncbi:hypothetical protein ACCS33_22730 [Rhizobium ruizarguesonis]|jgi:hypothetical protein